MITKESEIVLKQHQEKIVIIGNGIAGATAAIELHKYTSHKIFLISKESPFLYSRPALMYLSMGHMRMQEVLLYPPQFWENQGIQRITGNVIKIDFTEKQVFLEDGDPIIYDKLILATGAATAYPEWADKNMQGIRGFTQLEDALWFRKHALVGKNGIIVGGGLIGLELAEVLLKAGCEVHVFVRDAELLNFLLPPEERNKVHAHIESHGVRIHTRIEVQECIANAQGELESIITKQGEQFPCDLLGVATGVEPQCTFIKGSGLKMQKGILIDKYCRTNLPDVFAIGDCAELSESIKNRRGWEPIWYTAKQMGQTIAKYIAGRGGEYQQGTWYNSAKFFDLEYSIYGYVSNSGLDSLYVKMNKTGSLRIQYEPNTKTVLGFLGLGCRIRERACIHAIQNQVSIEQVKQNLSRYLFNTEFASESVIH